MAIVKYVTDLSMDAACEYVKNNATEMYICSGSSNPASRAAAISAALASKTGLTSGSFTGPADGTVSGRKITKNAESAVSITANGDATCVVLCSASAIISVNAMTLQNLTSGGTVNVPAFIVTEIRDVTP